MGFLSSVAAAALAQASPSATAGAEQLYYCEVVREAPAGEHRAFVLVDEAGQGVQAGVRWEQAPVYGAGGFDIRWTLDPKLQVTEAKVEVGVPLRKWKMGRAILGLRRLDDDGIADMNLMGPVLHGRAGSGRGVAQLRLRTLLDYAADADRLRWYVVSRGSNKGLGFGDIAMAPLREAVSPCRKCAPSSPPSRLASGANAKCTSRNPKSRPPRRPASRRRPS